LLLIVFIAIGNVIAGTLCWGLGMMRDTTWRDAAMLPFNALVFSLVIVAAFVFVTRMRDLLGAEVFRNLLLGRYHRPAEEERVFVKAVELIAEGGVGGIEVPDDAEDEWVGPGNIEQPVIIGEKRAALNGDAASDSKLPGESLQTRRKSRLIEGGYVRSWPGHSAGAGWIEEVNVSVNDLRHCW